MVLNQRNVSLSVYLEINIQTNPIASRDKTGKRIICVTFHQCIGCRFNRRVIHIHGQYLSHLRFADYIIILAESPNDLEEILSSLDDSSIREGLGMNINKTKFMHNRYVFRDSQPKWRYNQDCAHNTSTFAKKFNSAGTTSIWGPIEGFVWPRLLAAQSLSECAISIIFIYS